ncbi:DUF445 domain-containing protein [Paraglaciecola aquimarina]|uniref:DUF445 domain-containing protein n=1 Tax=Paraglaciecola algarum TaxID=3050085 RepID=A0ABS9D4U7_9ALTE|nr:DUF445 domain-containing protein [Paraglaciecola sp. G1-23]MCF2947901.1 DUF445 domain-containing protein [Paraglaciecola sp. G1-23]
MNKNLITNGLAILLIACGFILENQIIKTVGLFALSGAITNWIAIHMLFEKVPGLYGSGVIPERFEDFKAGIRNLIMQQFFTAENIQRFLTDGKQSLDLNLAPIIDKVDLAPTFDSLVAVIQASSFGQMLGMFGGVEALEPLKQPFIDKMTNSIKDITQGEEFAKILQEQVQHPEMGDDLQQKIANIVEQRLNELTPKMVKDIIQQMIKEHLGWLVVWGGVFGGLIGFIASITNI